MYDNAKLVQNFVDENGIIKTKDVIKNIGERYSIIAKTGGVIYDSELEGKEYTMSNHLYRPEIKEAEAGKVGFAIRKSMSTQKDTMYLATPIKSDFIVRVSTNYKFIEENLKSHIILNILFFILMDIFIIFLYKKYMISYLRNRLNEMQNILEHGEKAKEIYLEDDEDLKTFWRVIKRWQNKNIKNMEKLEGEMEKLKEVISAVDMGIIVMNGEGKIMIHNECAKGVIDSNIEGEIYFEKITHIELIKYINKLFENGTASKDELYLSSEKKYYIVEGKYIDNVDFYIITLKNITKEKEINEIQKRFITNISHELKTPLTNIKGYIVALRDEKDENLKKSFFNIVERNIEKIENMLKDFLNISKVESSKIVNKYPCQINKIFESVESMLEPLINKKGAEIKYFVETKLNDGYITIDSDKVFSILKNLVENAIIYSNEEPKIKINLKEEEKKYIFSVSDNGIGIPFAEQEKIFERFYRVDKARNTNVAGTGLGLAIVEEIIKIYNGKIEVESSEGKGTKFTFIIPKD